MRWIGLAVMVAAGVAWAQPSSQFLQEFQAGTNAYRLGKYDEARAHLERAAAIEPSLPGPPRFLAAVDAAEQKWEDCVLHARKAIVANPSSSEIVATRKLHDDCRAALDLPAFTSDYGTGGALAVEVNVAGAEITIGGLRAGASPLAPRPMALGAVEVSASKAGWKTAHGTATVIPGVVTDLGLVLEEDPIAVQVDTPPPVTTDGWLRLEVPAGAEVRIDGHPPVADDRGRYQLTAGPHQVEVTAPGTRPYRREIRVQRGQEQRVVVALETLTSQAARRRRGWIALGTAAGLGAVGAVTGWLALDAADQARDWAALERERPTTVPIGDTLAQAPLHTRAEIQARADRSATLATVSGVAFVASAAAVAAGIYFLAKVPDDAPVTIAPSIGDGWGLAVRGALP